MIDLTTKYLGLTLNNPLVASASPLCEHVENLQLLEEHGIGAVVLPSLYLWPRRSPLKKKGTIYVVIGKPIDPTGLDAREINARAQEWIEATIAEIIKRPGGNPSGV